MPNSSMYTKSAVLNWKVTFSSWAPYCMLHVSPKLSESLPSGASQQVSTSKQDTGKGGRYQCAHP